jgi:hypothetical protein
VIPEGHKWCPDCGDVLPLEQFVRTVRTKTGYYAYCKPCHNARGKASKERVGGSRSYHLTRRYGMTAEEADYLLERQDGLCAICGVAPAVHVDHDHETGQVRALLCFNCNGGLGQFKDDPYVLRMAAFYVERHRQHQVLDAIAEAARCGPEGSTRPGDAPVGSRRRPGARGAGSHTGRISRSRREAQKEEADG